MDAIGGAFEHQKGLLSVTPSDPEKTALLLSTLQGNGLILTSVFIGTRPPSQQHLQHARPREFDGKGERKARSVNIRRTRRETERGRKRENLNSGSCRPFTQSSEERLDDICHHFKGRADVIIMQGTRTGLMKQDPLR